MLEQTRWGEEQRFQALTKRVNTLKQACPDLDMQAKCSTGPDYKGPLTSLPKYTEWPAMVPALQCNSVLQ